MAGLSQEATDQIEATRVRIHESVSSIIALGNGGWNHGAKLMRSHAEAIYSLKKAEATLAEGSEDAGA